MNQGIASFSVAAALLVSGCLVSPAPQDTGRPKIDVVVEGEDVVIRVESSADTPVEVQNPTFFSAGPSHPGIGLLVRDGSRLVAPCALVNYARPTVDPDIRSVSRSSALTTTVGVAHLQRIYCLRPGEYQVQAYLVQMDSNYWSSNVTIRVR